MSMSIWGPTLQTTAPLTLCQQRDQGTRGGRECEDRPLRAWREASEASWSGFEVNQWAECEKESRKKRKSCKEDIRKEANRRKRLEQQVLVTGERGVTKVWTLCTCWKCDAKL